MLEVHTELSNGDVHYKFLYESTGMYHMFSFIINYNFMSTFHLTKYFLNSLSKEGALPYNYSHSSQAKHNILFIVGAQIFFLINGLPDSLVWADCNTY